jgi:signal transduction histidine kinase
MKTEPRYCRVLYCRVFKGGLLNQVALLALITTTVILSLFAWQRIRSQSEILTDKLHASLEADSHQLATALSPTIFNFDDATVETLCNSFLSDPAIILITVKTNHNQQQIIFPVGAASPTTPPFADDTISIEKTISHQEIPLATLQIIASTTSLKQQIRKTTVNTIIQIIVLDLLLVTVLLFFLSRQFVRPLISLQDAARNIAGGDLTHNISVQNRNELGLLAQDLEAMRGMLQEKISSLETEISDRLRAEEELKKTKNYLDNIINSMPSQLISVDTSNRITLWNARADQQSRISSHPDEERIVENIFPQLADWSEIISRAVANKEIHHEDAHLFQDGDSTCYEDITIYPLVSNGVEGAVIRIDDVTERHRMQEELAHSRKLEAIGQLTGGIAHDFNNMLTGIMGGAELLRRHIGDDTKGQQYLNMITQAAKRVAELNRKLLIFSRKEQIKNELVDVVQAVREAESILSHSLDKKITITVSVETKETSVIGDLAQLQNALINLGINSGHAMPQGGELSYRLLAVSLDEAYCRTNHFDIQPGRYLEIEVRDTGIGIPREIQNRILEPFFTTREAGKGTGLGLSAVHSAVQQHHGALSFFSEPGTGTSFHIYLPLAESKYHQDPLIDATPITGSGRILVIDDEPIIQDIAEAFLSHLGYEVVLADDGRKGLELFMADPDGYDLAITDMIMPNMDGEQCFHHMREVRPKVKVLMASGETRDTDIEGLKKQGLRGFIRKPYTIIELSRAVAAAMTEE